MTMTPVEQCRASGQQKIARGYCSAIKNMDYTQMKGSAIVFKSDGSVYGMNINWGEDDDGNLIEKDESYNKLDSYACVEGNDGDTFTVFPGTYRIEMTNFAGKTDVKAGVVVK